MSVSLKHGVGDAKRRYVWVIPPSQATLGQNTALGGLGMAGGPEAMEGTQEGCVPLSLNVLFLSTG